MTVTREGAGGTTAVCAWCESIPGSNYLPHEPPPERIEGFAGRAVQGQAFTPALGNPIPTSDVLPQPLRLAAKFCPRVGNRTDRHLLKHLSFLRVLGDARFIFLG